MSNGICDLAMRYISTRGRGEAKTFSETLLDASELSTQRGVERARDPIMDLISLTLLFHESTIDRGNRRRTRRGRCRGMVPRFVPDHAVGKRTDAGRAGRPRDGQSF